MEIRKVVNEHGVWFDIEEIIHNCQEIKFDKEGMFLDGELIFNWIEFENIKRDVFKGE